MKPEKIIKLIKNNLTPDLVKSQYRNDRQALHSGQSYVASEALFHILGANDSLYSLHYGVDENSTVHWWLVNMTTKEILDTTCEQYTSEGKTPPYDNGVKAAFLTKKISKRGKIVIDKINCC